MKGTVMGNDKKRLRRYEDDLNVGGLGVVILGAWDVLKVISHIIMTAKNVIDLGEFADDERSIAIVVIIGIIAVFTLLSLLVFKIHFYIGMNASRAARGEPYKKGYYIGAIILLVLSALGIFGYFDELKDLENIEVTVASLIVDLTMVYVLWIVVSSTGKIRKLKKLLQTQE